MKQTRLWLNTIAVLLCSLTASAHDFEVDGIYYNITDYSDLTVEVTYRGDSPGVYSDEYCGAVIIPSTVTYNSKTYSVTSIGGNAFSGCRSLTSITIPEGVTSIGELVFDGCRSLTSIIIPESMTSIGWGAFMGCSKLNAITIPESVTSIGFNAFSGCNGLTSLVVEEGNLVYDSRNGCNAIIETSSNTLMKGCSSTIIPEGVTSVAMCAFNGCSGLTSITIPEGVTRIDYATFEGCSGLTSITIPESVTSIGGYAFSGCSSLTSINIPESVTNIGENAFYGCSSLTSINIPESVTSIGNHAFYGCSSLTSINIPESVTSIGNYAFQSCTGELILNCNIAEDNRFSGSNFSRITIGDNVTSIGNNAFRGANNGNLELLVVGAGLTSIASSFFAGCNVAKVIWRGNACRNTGKINYTSNADYSGNSSFKVYPLLSSMFEADGLLYVPISLSERTCDVIGTMGNLKDSVICIEESVSYRNIPFEVQEVNPYAFYGNKSIKEVTIANKGNIGNGAFYGCDSLRKVSVLWDADTNMDSGLGNIGDRAFEGCTALSEVNLSDGVLGIGDQTFRGCTSLASISLPEKLAFLGMYAFENCTALSSFELPASVNAVGYALFAGCDSLKSIKVTEGNIKYDSRNNCNAIVETGSNTLIAACNATNIPDDIKKIANYAFSGCDEITTISLSKEVASVGDYAFQGCSKLANVIVEDRTQPLALGSNGSNALFSDCPLDSVYLGGALSYNTSSNKGYSPFSNNASLRKVTINHKEETIYPYEFYNCSSLQQVTVGNGVTSIGKYAFSGCTVLESFSFGSRVEAIGENAFAGCANLMKVVSSAVNPPVCGEAALDDINKWECVLRVPNDYKEAYQTADQWKEFLFIEDVVEVERYALTLIVDGEVYYTDSLAYSEAIVLPESPVKEGYTFEEWVGLPETMPIFDVTATARFSANKYALSYVVDGEVYRTDSIAYGDSIVIVAPTKEGYTFSGWSEAPETMPANDVVISGTFAINKYLVTFKIGDEVITADSLEYGAAIVVPEAPEREGHTFNGWGEVAETVPAGDVTYKGTYTVNIYKVYYYVDEELVHTAEVAYGEAIPEYIYEPTGEGDVFEGWIGETYETMPAHDVTYVANITTGIDTMSTDSGQQTTVIYDLTGRRVEKATKGVYIVNGKKAIVK